MTARRTWCLQSTPPNPNSHPSIPAKGIHAVRNRLQMVRAGTPLVTAEMVQFQVIANRPDKGFVGEDMGITNSPSGTKSAIATLVNERLPNPTGAEIWPVRRYWAVLINLGPESLKGCSGRILNRHHDLPSRCRGVRPVRCCKRLPGLMQFYQIRATLTHPPRPIRRRGALVAANTSSNRSPLLPGRRGLLGVSGVSAKVSANCSQPGTDWDTLTHSDQIGEGVSR